MATENYLQLDVDLGDLLQEFNDVVKELSTSHVNDQRLVKRPTGLSDAEDSDYSSETSLGNSLNASEEELNITGMSTVPTAVIYRDSLKNWTESLQRCDLTDTCDWTERSLRELPCTYYLLALKVKMDTLKQIQTPLTF